MHVLFQLKVPLDLAQGMREKLDEITTDHVAEIVQLKKRIKVAPDPTKLMEQERVLDKRGRRLSTQALVREALKIGYAGLRSLDSKALLERIAKDDVVRGRPPLKLASGVKRGG